MTTATGKRHGRVRSIGVGTTIVLLVIVYILSLISYSLSGGVKVNNDLGEVADGINLSIGVIEVDPAQSQVKLRAFIMPSGSYFDSTKGTYTTEIQLTSRFQTVGEVTTTIEAGTPVGGMVNFTLYLDGNSATYPFDEYLFGIPVEDADEFTDDDGNEIPAEPYPLALVEATTVKNNVRAPVPVGVADTDGINGWRTTWSFSHGEGGVDTLMATLSLKRGGGVIAFVCVVLALMILGVVLAGLVASRVARKQRPIEATMASWFAALLFALVPLRINLPGAPPIGAWIDVTVFYWVIMALMIAMAIFVGSWLRYRKPPED